MKGQIIVIEGTDGSGKRTQTEELYKHLIADGKNVRMQSFPCYESLSSGSVKKYLQGDLGQHADDVNAYQSSVFFTADRVATYLDKKLGLKEHYENGGIVVFDRYVQSNMVHQASKIKDFNEREKFLNWLNQLEFEDLSLPKADKVFFLDMPISVSKKLANSRTNLKAGTKQDIHEQDEKYLQHCYDTAKYVANKFNWITIPCLDKNGNLKTAKEIHEEIYKKYDK